jgi:hypothetical protein
MNDRMRHILEQINALEEELQSTLHEQETRLLYRIKGKRVEFEDTIRQNHRKLKTGLLHWFFDVRPQQLLTAPIIYGLIIPLLFLDICITLYQMTCFPIFRIAKARRSDYIVFDHQHLAYLNIFEKFHCLYCSYANGLLAYAREIAARTEQFFCPIKHARKILGAHTHYSQFLDYGEAEDFHARLMQLRAALAEKARAADNASNRPPPHT